MGVVSHDWHCFAEDCDFLEVVRVIGRTFVQEGRPERAEEAEALVAVEVQETFGLQVFVKFRFFELTLDTHR